MSRLASLKERLPRWFPLALIALVILIVSAVILLLLSNNNDKELIDNSYDVYELEETLSDKLTEEVKNNPHKDYQTELPYTSFVELTAEEFCLTSNFECPDILSQKLVKIPAINPNALSYYLDQNLAVVIVSDSSTLVIYGANYEIPSYLSFTTDQQFFDNFGYISKTKLFNNLTGSEAFYTYSPV